VLNFLKATVDDGSANQRAKIVAIYVLLFAANALVWTWAVIALAGRPTLLGTAVLAYVLGLRHAVDADHIAAIDNVVRKLMQEGKRPVSVGLFFSLGHSLVVTIAVAVIVLTAFALQGQLHPFKSIGSLIGTGASAFFLLAIAAINLAASRWRNTSSIVCFPDAASSPASFGPCSAWCRAAGRCSRLDFCSGLASTQRPRSLSSPSRRARLPAA
jgi:high-affinity nickel-transport protein